MSQELKPKNKRNILILVVSLIAVIAIGVGLWVYRSLGGEPDTPITTNPTPITTTQTSESGITTRPGVTQAKLTFSLAPGQASAR
ncbi:MAG: hypothetical protein M5U34_17000 [Chloroflexi bacterium]|nr:hypothetical protein [Chloroflexota bacterium]